MYIAEDILCKVHCPLPILVSLVRQQKYRGTYYSSAGSYIQDTSYIRLNRGAVEGSSKEETVDMMGEIHPVLLLFIVGLE